MKRVLFAVGLISIFLVYCASPVFAVDGWAGNTAGGAGGPTVTVTDEPNLIKYASKVTPGPYIVQVSGNITVTNSDGIRLSAKKTLRGIGVHPTITGNLNFNNRDSNMVIERLNFTNPHKGSAYDGISLKTDINNVFVTKCSFYDCGDGDFDISGRSNHVTVSWCKFYYTPSAPDPGPTFSCLVGSSDSQTEDRGKLKVTYHHNWWTTGVKERMPRVRFGQVHVYNNYYSNLVAGGYCVGVGVESNIRVENNYFNAVPNPWADYYTGNGAAGAIGWNTGNVFHDCNIPTWATNNYATIFTPPYSYTLDNAADIPLIVQNGAGADGNDTTLPHWVFTYYGDFDRNGIVDLNDLAKFADYWLVPDCNQLWNADYNGDCKVNFYEFSLLAKNWLYIPPDTTPPAAPTGLGTVDGNGTVSLDWSNNSESDLAGYNIYRSTTFGGSYTKLNTSLLSDSNYIDNTVSNDTIYYYVVTAEDTSSNESAYSSQVSAIPLGAGNIIIQESTTGFCDVNGIIEHEWAGYTGAGYANTTNALGNGINWKISVPSDGTYSFVWRYSVLTGNRTAKLIVNGTTVDPNISFPASGANTTYILTTPVDANLTAGTNTIRLEATTADGLGNIDYMRVTGVTPQAVSCQ